MDIRKTRIKRVLPIALVGILAAGSFVFMSTSEVVNVAEVAAQGQQGPQSGVIPIRVERHIAGAPLTFGIPFPKGALRYSHQVRVVNPQGQEVPSQVTEVTSWEPAAEGVKWAWIFFFAEESDRYLIEYGPQVRRAAVPAQAIRIINPQGNFTEVTTGPMRFVVDHRQQSGFIDIVQVDMNGNGFDDADTVATNQKGRGSFLDLLDDAGPDMSRPVINRVVVEKGSGPLQAILRVEGEYQYSRPDNNPAPFVTRIHAYAGRSYVRVLHTFVYTGEPDKARSFVAAQGRTTTNPSPTWSDGEHYLVATQVDKILPEQPGNVLWTQPDDRVAAAGLALDLKLTGARRYRTSYRDGKWWEEGQKRLVTRDLNQERELYLVQSGPKPSRTPPAPESSPDQRIGGFFANLTVDNQAVVKAERADGWMDFSDSTRGTTIGIRNFIEEYPKEIGFSAGQNRATAFIWSPHVEPMSYARSDSDPSFGMVENYAQGHAKTTEMAFNFHRGDTSESQIEQAMSFFLTPPVAHAEPSWYARSRVYGNFASRTDRFPEHERWIDNKFEWMLFNQKWGPWFGMVDYGDLKENFNGQKWGNWGNNEPTVDFMLWFQFMRTGDPRLYTAAEAASRHTMDVDNTHWPTDPQYYSDNNNTGDWFNHLRKPRGSPLVGAGHRHARQHWMEVMGAHVWVQGWMANYYLSGYHRGLDMVMQTADFHLRRQWGEFELDARRLPLSIWNLLEAWDATKDVRYEREIEYRLEWMQRRQLRDQGNVVMDRYGFTHLYGTHALSRYVDLTGDKKARAMLVTAAERMRDVPPVNRLSVGVAAGGDGDWPMTSSVHGLVVGYQLTGDITMLEEAKKRIALMKSAPLPRPVDGTWTQRQLYDTLRNLQPQVPLLDMRYLARIVRGGEGGAPSIGSWGLTADLHDFGFVLVLPYALDAMGTEGGASEPR